MKDESLEGFLRAVAAPTPTPGGGSVAALAGALAVALARMIAGLARDKPGYETAQEGLRRLDAEAGVLQERLVALAEEDSQAYRQVVAAMRLPKSTDEERVARVDAMQAAYKHATDVPIETIERCVEALELVDRAAHIGNRGAITDAGVATLLAEAAIRGAALNCRINLASIRDEAFRSKSEARLETLLGKAAEAAHRTMSFVESNL